MRERETCLIQLEGELTIGQARDIRDHLLAALKGSGRVMVDLSRVSEFDSAGVQLLLAARRSAAAAGTSIGFTGPAEPVRQAMALLGLAGELAADDPEGDPHESR